MKISKQIKNIVIIFILVKLFIFLVGTVGFYTFPISEDYYRNSYVFQEKENDFFSIWNSWDTQWYLRLAEEGYSINPQQASDVQTWGFFPMLPLLMWLFSFIFQNKILTGLIISNTASFISIIYLYNLLKVEYSERISKRTVLYSLIFPTAFFFSMIYTESLFFMFTIMSFYYMRKDNIKLASLFGMCSALTRFIGILIIIPLIVEHLKFTKDKLRIKKKIIWLFTIPLGTLLYFTYMKITTGYFFSYFSANTFWGRSAFSLTSIIETFTQLHLHYPRYSMVDIITSVIFLVLLYFIYRKLKLSYFIYCAYVVLIPLSSGSFMSMPRMILVGFPFFLYFALLGENKYWNYFFISVFSILLTISTVMFVNHYWVA